MAASAEAVRVTVCGAFLPKLRKPLFARLSFGELALAAFLLVQGLDGVYTYIGVAAYGLHAEANPIVASLMANLGNAPGVMSAKVIASLLGVCLYFCQVHAVVALLTGLYLTAAIAPWTVILFF